MIFGISAENRGRKQEFQRVGAGSRVFIGLGCKIGKGNRARYGISILLSCPLQKPQADGNEPFVRKAVSGFM